MKKLLFLILFALTFVSTSKAQEVERLNIFKPSEPAKAEEVNDNFKILRDAINNFTSDHSNSGYIRIGNLQICWGSLEVAEGKTWTSAKTHSYLEISKTITFQQPFRTLPVVTISATDGAIAARSAYVSFYRVSTSGIAEFFLSSPKPTNARIGLVTLFWIAIGTWQ